MKSPRDWFDLSQANRAMRAAIPELDHSSGLAESIFVPAVSFWLAELSSALSESVSLLHVNTVQSKWYPSLSSKRTSNEIDYPVLMLARPGVSLCSA